MLKQITTSCLFGCLLFTLAGCKKSVNLPDYATTIQFTYNGQVHTRSAPSSISTNFLLEQGYILLVNFAGLLIKDENNLLGGDVVILANAPGPVQCAFLSPAGNPVSAPGGNCSQLNTGGNPIDSVAVYWYESGSISFSYTDCKAITSASVQGQYDCAINGTFDVTLTNKLAQKIRLTNGSFKGRIRKF